MTATNRRTIVIEFDREVYDSMDEDQQNDWEDQLTAAINDVAHLVSISA